MSKLRLVSETQVPYGGGYTITDPMTNVQVYGTTFKMVCDRIRDARKANSVPIGLGFEDEVESWICAKYAVECFDSNAIKPRQLSLSDIVAGSRVMLSHWWNGRKIVSREEAERRGAICVSCPMNVKFSKPCNGMCPELSEVVSGITNAQGTRFDVSLHSCSLCGCHLQSAIWVPLELQTAVLTDKQVEQFESIPECWKKPSLTK